MRYGVPYQGSKNGIAREIVCFLPPGEVLIDLCAGGCAITHAALELCDGFAPKWGRIVSNDINPMPGRLFADAVAGRYRDERRWIGREDFFRLRDEDAWVRYGWSYGAMGDTYLYSVEREPWCRAVHAARVLGDRGALRAMGIDSDGSKQDIEAHEEQYREAYIAWYLRRMPYGEAELREMMARTREEVHRTEEELRAYLRGALARSGLTQAEVQRRLGTQMAGHYFGRSQWSFPTREHYERMQAFLPLDQPYDEIVGLYRLRRATDRMAELSELTKVPDNLTQLDGLARLDGLRELERLRGCLALDRLEQTCMDYAALPIPEGAIVYADIPYMGTDCKAYDGFDHQRFFDWAASQRARVYISSYEITDERFACVWETDKRCLLQGASDAMRKERIYTQRRD